MRNLYEQKKLTDNKWRLSYDLETHRLNEESLKFRKRYLRGLVYVQNKFNIDDDFSRNLLGEYYKKFLNEDFNKINFLWIEKNEEKNIRFICKNKIRKFKFTSYYCSFLYDCLLINAIENENMGRIITEYFKSKLNKNKQIQIEEFCNRMYLNKNIEEKFEVEKENINMWQENRKFFKKNENRILITANMSAGKSTLINTIIGKKIALTKNESCTSEVQRYFNKIFEDDKLISISENGEINTISDITNYDIELGIGIYTYMKLEIQNNPKITIIDTPGVNSSIDLKHKDITQKILVSQEYDKVIYVINATNIGSDDDYIHLNEVYNCLDGRKIIFILNKIDMFRSKDDSIDESISELKKQLEKIGFKNPIICPTSAYAAGIFKKLIFSKLENDEEEDECRRLLRKFSRKAFDLNGYYSNECNFDIEDKEIIFDEYSKEEIIECFKRTGIINIEDIIMGGNK